MFVISLVIEFHGPFPTVSNTFCDSPKFMSRIFMCLDECTWMYVREIAGIENVHLKFASLSLKTLIAQ